MDKKIKLMFLLPSLRGGGAERVISNIANSMDKRKYSISICVVNLHDSKYTEDLENEIKLINFDKPKAILSIHKIIHHIYSETPDVIVSVVTHINIITSFLKPLIPSNIKLIGRETINLSSIIEESKFGFLYFLLIKKYYLNYDFIIAQSIYMKQDLIKNFHIPESMIEVIHNPINFEKILKLSGPQNMSIYSNSASKKLIAAGRLTKEKGFDILIDAMDKCRNLNLNLTILGDGPLEDDLRNQIYKLKLDDRIILAGFQANPYLFFKQSDVFILSSRYEGFPNVVLEALACGIPVIGTPSVGGFLEIADISSSCYVASNISSNALADAIKSWLQSPKKNVKLNELSPFELSKITRKYDKLIRATCGLTP